LISDNGTQNILSKKLTASIKKQERIILPKNVVSSSDIYDKNQEKHDDARSISMMNKLVLDWFRPSHGVIVMRLVFAVLCYEI
jgi:hypothetical protein